LGSLAQSEWKVIVVVATLLMGGFAALLERGGALSAFFRKAEGSRSVEGGAFFAGIVCFFDGLANSLLVGRVMRGAFDRCGLPRERLAFIADSTASPVACLGVASTWIAYQLAMIEEGASAAGVEVSPYGLYFAAWPAMFYCWAALLGVALFVFTRWTFGPMRRVTASHVAEVFVSGESTPGLWRAFLPIGVLLVALIGGLVVDGAGKLNEGSAFSFVDAVGAADSGRVLLLGVLAGCAAAWACFPRGNGRAGEVFLSGAQGMLYPVAILVLAWALGATLKQLGAANLVAAMLADHFPRFLYPALVFLVACAVSFSTGTSWGTMGVLMPVALPAAIALAGSEGFASSPLVVGTVAGVMGGAVFGDHSSPVSDTTIVSATAAGCDTWSHFATQWPYALVAGGISLVFGYLPLGLGIAPWICLGMVVVAMGAIRLIVRS
jgi:Na+/H+ antiporter NhaC